jgi:glycine cleavage system aminomethyltransferase T
MFGHTVGKPLGLGYVENDRGVADAVFIHGGHYEIEVAGERVPVEVSLQPFYDPSNRRVKDLPSELRSVLAVA